MVLSETQPRRDPSRWRLPYLAATRTTTGHNNRPQTCSALVRSAHRANAPGRGMAARLGTGMAMPPPMTGMRTAMGTALGTAMGGGASSFGGGVREGKFTEKIYGLIRDSKYDEAIQILSSKLFEFPSSRAAASLLAYCYYHAGDYQNALQSYEQLMRLCPDVDAYKLYYAQVHLRSP